MASSSSEVALSDVCNHCGATASSINSKKKLSICSACRAVSYCNVKCQKADRKRHKAFCRRVVLASSSASSGGGGWASNDGTTSGATTAPESMIVGNIEKSPTTISFLTHAIPITCTDPNWEAHYDQVTADKVQELPQVVLQAWYIKKVRYWSSGTPRPLTNSNVQWYLEVLNASPMIHNDTNYLLLYREPWRYDDDESTDDNNNKVFLQRLLKIIFTAMLEGGNVASKHSTIESTKMQELKANHPNYFFPRRPGVVFVDPTLSFLVKDIGAGLKPLNMETRVFGEHGGDDPLPGLFETPGNTVYEPSLDVTIRCLSKQEREELFEEEGSSYKTYFCTDDMYPTIDSLLEVKTNWEWEDFESLEEAMEQHRNEQASEEERAQEEERLLKELTTKKVGWELDHNTLEEACMDAYDARSIQEAIWDLAGVPRLLCKDANVHKKLMGGGTGWRYLGYKPGHDYCPCESNVKYGQREFVECGHAWVEGRR